MIVPHGAPQTQALLYMPSSLASRRTSIRSRPYNLVMSNQWRAYEPVLVSKRIPSSVALVIKQLHTTAGRTRRTGATAGT
jgi:hypothetical protein